MELKSLFLGLTFTIGIFALKSGIGMHYLFTQRRYLRDRLLFICGFAFTYLFIFFVSYLILKKIDIFDYYTVFQWLFSSAMYIHVFMAAGLILWGIYLLKKEGARQGGSRAFWAMIIPCPVCASVLFLTTAFLMAYFPNIALSAVMGAYLYFIAIAFFAMLSMAFWEVKADVTPEHTLATAMLFIAVYFILSIIIMPQFTDIDMIYRIASYEAEKGSMNIRGILSVSGAVIALFLTGYLIMRQKIRRERIWI